MFGFLLNDLEYLSNTIPELLELNKVELNEEGKAASLCFTRAQRFIEGYYAKRRLQNYTIVFLEIQM